MKKKKNKCSKCEIFCYNNTKKTLEKYTILKGFPKGDGILKKILGISTIILKF